MLITNLFKYWTAQIFSPSTALRKKYVAFKSLLAHDKRAHELMAELEDIYYHQQKRDFNAIVKLSSALSRLVAGIVEDLSKVCPARYPDLRLFYKKIDAYIRHMIIPESPPTSPPYVLPLEKIGTNDLQLVGGKALNLGIVKNALQLPVPDGYVITTRAFHQFILHNDLQQKINADLAAVDINDTQSLDAMSAQIQEWIMTAEIPLEMEAVLTGTHASMAANDRYAAGFAMRSSAVGEDSRVSFAGQYLTVLNVQPQNLCETYKKIIAGKYSPEAIYYRVSYGLTDVDTAMAVLVLNMVPAVASGVMYTAEIMNPQSDQMKIHSIWGLGELLVGGQTPTDTLTISKNHPYPIIKKDVATKRLQTMLKKDGQTESRTVDKIKAEAFSLSDGLAKILTDWGITLEGYYRKPQDIEWAVNSSGNAFILQTRPLHTGRVVEQSLKCEFEDIPNKIVLHGGECAASGIATGVVFNTKHVSSLHTIPENTVLVAGNALPQYAKVINRLSAVVTDTGSSAGHFASVAREFGVPMLVNTHEASHILEHGREVTVHADGRAVYAGTVAEMLESPCARIDLIIDSPFMRKLDYIMKFVSTLDLVDPQDPSFAPQYCRSFHDIIRFAHEKAVQEMFHLSDNRLRRLSLAKKLVTHIPMNFFVLDVGGGLKETSRSQKEISIDDVYNGAMRSVWAGLSHPDIQWGSFSHFDWEAHDRIVMSGGIASPKSTMFASHAVISNDYMNLNLRFGYHFVIVDALCGHEISDNTILFRFSGGGADMDQRMLRTDFLSQVLRRLGFDVTVVSDLIDGRLNAQDEALTRHALDMLGRLLGATRLMDMYLKDASMIEGFVDDFMQGRYHFASTDM
jgi:pyruvate, water dikinase